MLSVLTHTNISWQKFNLYSILKRIKIHQKTNTFIYANKKNVKNVVTKTNTFF